MNEDCTYMLTLGLKRSYLDLFLFLFFVTVVVGGLFCFCLLLLTNRCVWLHLTGEKKKKELLDMAAALWGTSCNVCIAWSGIGMELEKASSVSTDRWGQQAPSREWLDSLNRLGQGRAWDWKWGWGVQKWRELIEVLSSSLQPTLLSLTFHLSYLVTSPHDCPLEWSMVAEGWQSGSWKTIRMVAEMWQDSGRGMWGWWQKDFEKQCYC